MRENSAQLYGPQVSNFLPHRRVKSLTFRIYGTFKFQCTRNGPQNVYIFQGHPRTPLLVVPRYLTTMFSKMILQKQKQNIENGKMKIPKPRSTNIRYVLLLSAVLVSFIWQPHCLLCAMPRTPLSNAQLVPAGTTKASDWRWEWQGLQFYFKGFAHCRRPLL